MNEFLLVTAKASQVHSSLSLNVSGLFRGDDRAALRGGEVGVLRGELFALPTLRGDDTKLDGRPFETNTSL